MASEQAQAADLQAAEGQAAGQPAAGAGQAAEQAVQAEAWLQERGKQSEQIFAVRQMVFLLESEQSFAVRSVDFSEIFSSALQSDQVHVS